MSRRYGNDHLDRKIIITIILPIVRIENAGENVDRFFLKMAAQSYLVIIVLIMHNK